MTLGDRVKQVRIGQGWSQAELANRVSKVLRRKVTQVAIHHIESRGAVNPRFVVELAQVLGVSLDWLQHGRGAQADNQPTPAEKIEKVFISHSGEPSKELTDLLNKLCEVPEGSVEEKAVTTLLRFYFRKKDRGATS